VPVRLGRAGQVEAGRGPAELARAKEAYQAAAKVARDGLVTAFGTEDRKAECKPRLSAEQYSRLFKQVADERKAFEGDPTELPKSPATASAVKAYQQATAAARANLTAAFDKAAESYRGKDRAALEGVLADTARFAQGARWWVRSPPGPRRLLAAPDRFFGLRRVAAAGP
jgi:hypothetical protein